MLNVYEVQFSASKKKKTPKPFLFIHGGMGNGTIH
jgi:hypothetical protein